MCAWNTTAPDGTKSVAANNTIIQANTTYTKTTLNVDHFWDDSTSSDNDGHHQFVQMPKSVTSMAPIIPTDPAIATLMDLVYYAKQKTATESPSNEDVQPFVENMVGVNTHIMQLLGIRACAVFTYTGAPGAQTIDYAHNVTTVSQTATGKYDVTFTNDLPSNAYLMLGGGIRDNTNDTLLNVSIESNTSLADVKTIELCKILTARAESGVLVDPFQAWLVVFGG